MRDKIILVVADRSVQNLATFKYFGTTVTNQDHVLEEIMGHYIRGMLATIHAVSFDTPSPL
jgi:hypothetical protein